MWLLNWLIGLFRESAADVEPDHDAALEEELLDEEDEDEDDEAQTV